MTSFEYFTFDVTHKYFNKKKTESINYNNGFYISGTANNFRRYSLKKINNDILKYHNNESQYLQHNKYKAILTTKICKKKSIKN